MFDQATIEMLLEGVMDTLYMTLVSTFFLCVRHDDGDGPRHLAVRTASRHGP